MNCKGLVTAICFIKINIWLIFLLEKNTFDAKTRLVCHFISLCTHFRDFADAINYSWLSSVTLHWMKKCQCQTKVFWGFKAIFRGNNYTSPSMKHSCFLRDRDWSVRMFPYLSGNDWQTRGTLLNYWHGYQKLYL